MKFPGLFLALATVLMAVTPAFSTSDDTVPLIPREVLFGNPVKASPRLSPCGTRLAYLAPSDKGVLNVWVRTIGKEDDVQVTNDTHRGIRIHFWAEDGTRLFYLQDIGGDENWHVYSVDLETKAVRDLTPFQGVRAANVMLDKKFPEQMLVGLNLRDRRVFDMYRVNLSTGAITLDTQNPGDVLGWVTDPDFQIRACQAQNPQRCVALSCAYATTRTPPGATWSPCPSARTAVSSISRRTARRSISLRPWAPIPPAW